MTNTTDNRTEPPRPIRWDPPDKGLWSLETAHYGGVSSVPMRDHMERGFAEGFRASFAQLGVPISHIEMRHLNGWPYVSFFLHDVPRGPGKPPPAFVLKVLTRVHPGFRKRTKIAAAAIESNRALRLTDEWERERGSWIARNLELQRVHLGLLDNGELAAHVGRVTATAAEGIRRHFELVPGCIPLGQWLSRSAHWNLPPDAVRAAVMHSTPVHAEAHRRLVRIVDALGDTTHRDLDGIRSHSAEAAAALDDYIEHHGWWATEDSLMADRVLDHPTIILAAIAATRSAAPGPDEQDNTTVLAGLRQRVPESDRAEFDRLAAEAHRAHTMLDDNSGILASWLGGIAGEAFREAGRRLVADGRLHAVHDIWALPDDDIVALLDGRSSLTVEDLAATVAAWHHDGSLTPPPHLNGEPGPPPDPGVFPAPVAQLMTAIGAFLNDKFNDQHHTSGIGTHAVTGRAVVTRSASDAFDRLQPGDILVTTATTPAYNAILPIVSGLIVSEGGPSCHAAIVARELGLPAIVGLRDALSTIPDGATITLDPVTARVSLA